MSISSGNKSKHINCEQEFPAIGIVHNSCHTLSLEEISYLLNFVKYKMLQQSLGFQTLGQNDLIK